VVTWCLTLCYEFTQLTHGAEPFLRSCQLCSYSRTSQHFTEPGGSWPPSTGPYPKPDRSNPYQLCYELSQYISRKQRITFNNTICQWNCINLYDFRPDSLHTDGRIMTTVSETSGLKMVTYVHRQSSMQDRNAQGLRVVNGSSLSTPETTHKRCDLRCASKYCLPAASADQSAPFILINNNATKSGRVSWLRAFVTFVTRRRWVTVLPSGNIWYTHWIGIG
jgi:hypothetical protein